jgi:Family of unknown function (DUF6510)
MESESLHTDGNEMAGILQEVFVAEITAAPRVCQSCHTENPVGAHRLYHGAGLVLRCPHCGDIAASVVVRPDANVISLHGTWSLARSE